MATRTVLRTEPSALHRRVLGLASGYLAITVLTLVAVVLLRHHHGVVNDAVWVRGIIVTASALLTMNFAVRATHGSRRGLIGLRVVSIVMPIAIVVIIATPGLFPLWMRIDQAICGLVLVALVTQVWRRHPRSK